MNIVINPKVVVLAPRALLTLMLMLILMLGWMGQGHGNTVKGSFNTLSVIGTFRILLHN